MNFDLATANINYLKITYKDRDSFAHCIKAAAKCINNYEILASIKSDENLNIETPQDIELGVICADGLYKAKTKLIRITTEDSYIIFYIQTPKDIDFQQKREFFRVKLNENANIIYEENEKIIKLSTITYDISANGVRIELDKNLTFPDEVRIMLYLSQRTIDIKAKYIRTDNEDDIIKASFQFEKISQSDLDYISQICLKKQLEERKKNLM